MNRLEPLNRLIRMPSNLPPSMPSQAMMPTPTKAMQAAIQAEPNLEVIEGGIVDLVVVRAGSEIRATGVVASDGRTYNAAAVVLTTGTFLNGLIHIGETKIPAGRPRMRKTFVAPMLPLPMVRRSTPRARAGRRRAHAFLQVLMPNGR